MTNHEQELAKAPANLREMAKQCEEYQIKIMWAILTGDICYTSENEVFITVKIERFEV